MHRYALGLGSNRTRGVGRRPAQIVTAAMDALAPLGQVVARSRIVETSALGPAGRRFANAAVLIDSDLTPPELLARLKAIERAFGRRPGQRWGARVIDLDIILWSGGAWSTPGLTIPHAAFRERGFVLEPLARLAPRWRDPLTGSTMRHLAERHRRSVDRPRRRH